MKAFESVHVQFGAHATSAWDGTDRITVDIKNEEFEEIKVISCNVTWRLEDQETEFPLVPKDIRWVRLDPFGDGRDSFLLPRRLLPGYILQCNFELTPRDVKESGVDVSKYPIPAGGLRLDLIILRATVEMEDKHGMRMVKRAEYHLKVDKETRGRIIEPTQSETEILFGSKMLQEREENMVTVQPSKIKPSSTVQKVFIVHGHDQEMRESVARTIEKLGLDPIILHEQPNQGRTIIEKFTDYGNVSFAVVLLSPDDMGYPMNESPKKAKARARQNVILELGFFIGKLGRGKVMPLYKVHPNFEMPSDYSGVLYTPYDDSGKWRFTLVTELQAAGYNIDANKLTKRL